MVSLAELLDQTVLPRPYKRLGTVGGSQLREQIGHMLLHCHKLDDQVRCDLLIGGALSEQA